MIFNGNLDKKLDVDCPVKSVIKISVFWSRFFPSPVENSPCLFIRSFDSACIILLCIRRRIIMGVFHSTDESFVNDFASNTLSNFWEIVIHKKVITQSTFHMSNEN